MLNETAMDGSELDAKSESSSMLPMDDQCFLLYFIIGTYFGPDLQGEMPQKSVLQRRAEGLPPYTLNQLGGSHMKMVEIERIYYYVLRKADQSAAMTLPLLHRFFQGNLPIHAENASLVYPQFPDLFPPDLHPHSRYENRYRSFENIVFINDPEISYTKSEDIERFKRLTGLEDFLLDGEAARLHTFVVDRVLYDVALQQDELMGALPSVKSTRSARKTRRVTDVMRHNDPISRIHVVTPVRSALYNGKRARSNRPVEKVGLGPAMIFFPSQPKREEWNSIIAAAKKGIALTGTAAMGKVGPIIGLMDIGESEDSYLFRVSLPGVKRNDREFSCEVENDGKVLIRGVTTTGEKTVHRHSQAFEMKTQNLCPPGHFSISFQLPGPVDPQHFSGNFGTDGILEGIVMKGTQFLK